MVFVMLLLKNVLKYKNKICRNSSYVLIEEDFVNIDNISDLDNLKFKHYDKSKLTNTANPMIVAEIGQVHDGSLHCHTYVDELIKIGVDAQNFKFICRRRIVDDSFR